MKKVVFKKIINIIKKIHIKFTDMIKCKNIDVVIELEINLLFYKTCFFKAPS